MLIHAKMLTDKMSFVLLGWFLDLSPVRRILSLPAGETVLKVPGIERIIGN